ncbi:MAG TPA: flagellar hook-basal body complex protein FliE [Armatimonadota bacterium]|nr:flagellar hook-basal body complex protein FliE [Armatimonadota bacterium]
MAITGIGSTPLYSPQQVQRPADARPAAESAPASGFGEQITAAIDHVDAMQKTADQAASQVAAGDAEDTHKAMIAMERALLALDFTVQVRNKMLEAYQEIMRTQL